MLDTLRTSLGPDHPRALPARRRHGTGRLRRPSSASATCCGRRCSWWPCPSPPIALVRAPATALRAARAARRPRGGGRPAPRPWRLRLDNVSRLPSGVLLMEDALPYALGGRPRFVLDRVEPRGVREVCYPVRSESLVASASAHCPCASPTPSGCASWPGRSPPPTSWSSPRHVSPLPPVRLGGDWSGGGDTTPRSIADERHRRRRDAGVPPRRRPAQGALDARPPASASSWSGVRSSRSRAARRCCSTAARGAHRGDGPGRRSSGR